MSHVPFCLWQHRAAWLLILIHFQNLFCLVFGTNACDFVVIMWLWVVIITLGIIALSWRWFPLFHYTYRQRKYLHNLPGWPTHWLWGNLHQLKADEESTLSWCRYTTRNGLKLTRVYLGPFKILVGLLHPDVIRQVLKEPKAFVVHQFLSPWLGDGLLLASNPTKWSRNRRLLTPAFHFEILKPYVAVYNACLESVLAKWTEAAERDQPVATLASMRLLTLDIILQCAFSYRSDCQNVTPPYIKCVYELLELCSDRFMTPLYHVDWIYSLSPSGRRMKRACATVHSHSEQVIRERKKALCIKAGLSEAERESILKSVTKKRKYCDFLDILLTAVDSDGNGLSDLEIRDEADTFMFEGHDTTTSGISWTLYCLAKYPEHQAKVREEVRSVLMGREWLDYEDLKDLQYTQWAIKEAMRLYPPVPTILRSTSQDIVLDNHFIPKDTMLGIDILALHRRPDVWENPEEYDPMRFHPSVADTRDPLAYMPFSAGSRNCIGQNFAMNEEKVVVATLVNRFELSLVENHKVEFVPKVVLHAKYDMKLKLKKLL